MQMILSSHLLSLIWSSIILKNAHEQSQSKLSLLVSSSYFRHFDLVIASNLNVHLSNLVQQVRISVFDKPKYFETKKWWAVVGKQ